MSEVACIKRKIKDKECLAIKWRDILIGYVFEENPDEWRISNDLKGEFWSLETYPTEQIATETLVNKKKSLDDFRLGQISAQK